MATSMASEYPHPLPSPPPVYSRFSPPPPITQRRPSMIARKPLPADASLPQALSTTSAPPAVQPPHDQYDVPPIPTAALARLSVVDPSPSGPTTHGPFPPRRDSYAAPRRPEPGHTRAGSGSWSAGEPQASEETSSLTKTSGSSSEDHDAQSGHQSSSRGSLDSIPQAPENCEPLHYHHRPYRSSLGAPRSTSTTALVENGLHAGSRRPRRPRSAYSFVSDGQGSPHASPYLHARNASRNSTASPDVRPLSFVDLLHTSYPQPGPTVPSGNHAHLRASVGNHASLLTHQQTFDMYRANVKKTDDPAVQYDFAVFMVNATLETPAGQSPGDGAAAITRLNLLKEARSILQRLADRSYPFAQYYLADGYASGLFHKGKEDYDRAFPLFVAASKHGHVEACYRTALCYEFGWGTRVDAARAQQFYRQAASKNHPGALLRMAKACLAGDMGLGKRYREGIKWMKRAAESSDEQYPAAPYELGLLHEQGYGDDVFADPAYAAQLFTKSADLGHAEASYRLGDAYEHGTLDCPRDPALSIHFYTGAAQGGHALAMMALCAWYLVGAEPVLEKDENEAYEWSKRAANLGLAKAEYATGYFTEMGIGCRRDPLEANVWYVKAADQGDERATHRIAAIRAAAEGVSPGEAAVYGKGKGKGKRFGIF
ncbi:putative chitin synthase activator (Chs3) [Aspergillus candidus]|uniref:HCP-like protein n=1 Tax=Aspergillus candidus TaxID=41067 RepID=A0A2I2F956_ASPCN|nr:HCP-like protein [Aspergillus candidus]PLB37151.1 HCP-like protein [Aspergillus candidus]